MSGKLLGLTVAFAATAFCADQALVERGAKEEAGKCTACHSLRIVHSQRLSKTTWGKELDKMAGWGVSIGDRQALIEYLVVNFGDDQPPQPAALTKDGTLSAKP